MMICSLATGYLGKINLEIFLIFRNCLNRLRWDLLLIKRIIKRVILLIDVDSLPAIEIEIGILK